jgi:hypothetical protein
VRTLLTLLVAWFIALPAAAAPGILLGAYSTTGLSADETARLKAELFAALEADGAERVGGESTLDDACAAAPDCVAKAAADAGAILVVQVRIVRAGPIVQVSAIAHDAAGAVVAEEERVANLAELSRETLLPAAVRARVRALVEAEAAAAAPAEPAVGGDGDGPSSTSTPGAMEEEPELPLLGIVGLGVGAGGLVMGLVGAGLWVNAEDVLNASDSDGAEKAFQRDLYPAWVGLAVVGGVVALGGLGIAAFGMWDME